MKSYRSGYACWEATPLSRTPVRFRKPATWPLKLSEQTHPICGVSRASSQCTGRMPSSKSHPGDVGTSLRLGGPHAAGRHFHGFTPRAGGLVTGGTVSPRRTGGEGSAWKEPSLAPPERSLIPPSLMLA